MKARNSARGFTLIELLIVVAIIAIMVDPVFRTFVNVLRAERGTTLQSEALDSVSALERAWREDVHSADAQLARSGEYTSSSHTLILSRPAGTTTATREFVLYRVVQSAARKDKRSLAVHRTRFDERGTTQSDQTIGTAFDAVTFGADTRTTTLLTLSADVTAGFAMHVSRQAFTAIAALGGAK